MSDVSVTTIARIERAKRTGSPYIRFRLLNALNRFADEEGHSEITIEDLFPQDGHRP
jgi:transcriptional regulator with XRE-family HTH domain